MTVYNENQVIKVIHVTENFSWATTSYVYHQTNYHTKAQKSQIRQNPSSPNCFKFSFFPIFIFAPHSLSYLFFFLFSPSEVFFLIGAYINILPLQILYVRKEALLLQ